MIFNVTGGGGADGGEVLFDETDGTGWAVGTTRDIDFGDYTVFCVFVASSTIGTQKVYPCNLSVGSNGLNYFIGGALRATYAGEAVSIQLNANNTAESPCTYTLNALTQVSHTYSSSHGAKVTGITIVKIIGLLKL